MDDLRLKLENERYTKVSFMIVNNQGERFRLKYQELRSRLSDHIPVYQQEEDQPDVWSLLQGNKNDFFIYDRCGRLVKHIGLPFSFLQFSYVEDAIKSAYCESSCGECSHQIPDDVCKKSEPIPAEGKLEEEPVETPKHHRHRHGHRQQEEEAVVGDPGEPIVGHEEADVGKPHHHTHNGVAHRNEMGEGVGGVSQREHGFAQPQESGKPAVRDKL